MKKTALFLLASAFLFGACQQGPEFVNPAPGTDSDKTPSTDGFDAQNGMNATKTAMLDRRDQKIYAITQIGDQYWMAENLDFESASSAGADPEKHGRAYYWQDAMQGASSSDAVPSGVQGVCPAGWHLPSDAEWQVMEQSLGMSSEQAAASGAVANRGAGFGDMLKSTTGWSESGNGSNSSGFNALPTGVFDSVFANQGDVTHFWSATEYINPNPDLQEAWSRTLRYEHDAVERSFSLQGLGYFVRCVAD